MATPHGRFRRQINMEVCSMVAVTLAIARYRVHRFSDIVQVYCGIYCSSPLLLVTCTCIIFTLILSGARSGGVNGCS